MEKTQLLIVIFACFLLTFSLAHWFDSFILMLVVCAFQVRSSFRLVDLFEIKQHVAPQVALCFHFGVGCKVLGLLMFVFPLNGFYTFYTLGTVCTLGSLLFVMENSSVQEKINKVEAKVTAIVNSSSAQVEKVSEQWENVFNKNLDDSMLEIYIEWHYSDTGCIAQGLCALLFPKLGVLLLTLTAVVDAGLGTRARVGAVVLGATGGMGVPAFFGLVEFGGLGFSWMGALGALAFGGGGALVTLFFWGQDGLTFVALEVLAGLVAHSLGGLSGLFSMAIGSLAGLAALTVGQEEHAGADRKGTFLSSLKTHPSAAVLVGALGGLAALAMGLDVLDSLSVGALCGLAGQDLGGVGGPGGVGGQGKPVSTTESPNDELEHMHDKKTMDRGKQKKTDRTLNTLEVKIKFRLMKTLHYSTLATMLWNWETALFLLILQFLICALFYIICQYSKSISALLCFVFGAGCTIMGVYLRFLPDFSLLLFSVLFTVGNVFILESTLLLNDFSTQQLTLLDNTRRVITSVIIVCLMLTLLALFWWKSLGLSLLFCMLHISSRYFLTLWRIEVS